MASETHSDQPTSGRDQRQDSRSPPRQSPPGGPPILRDGLELPRSSHC